jgi:hypothetical protein
MEMYNKETFQKCDIVLYNVSVYIIYISKNECASYTYRVCMRVRVLVCFNKKIVVVVIIFHFSCVILWLCRCRRGKW